MPSILQKSEPLPVEVGNQVYWAKLETRKITSRGSTEVVIQYWAFLPPGMRPAIIRGADRQAVVEQVNEAVRKQAR
jgi:hypothetical protein